MPSQVIPHKAEYVVHPRILHALPDTYLSDTPEAVSDSGGLIQLFPSGVGLNYYVYLPDIIVPLQNAIKTNQRHLRAKLIGHGTMRLFL